MKIKSENVQLKYIDLYFRADGDVNAAKMIK